MVLQTLLQQSFRESHSYYKKKSQQILSKMNAITKRKKMRLYNHGLGHVAETSDNNGVVFLVPQIKISSASSTECDLSTLVNKSFQFKSTGFVLPTYPLIESKIWVISYIDNFTTRITKYICIYNWIATV